MGIGFRELLIIAIIVVLLFGAKKIPKLARGIGEGLREFKRASRDETPKTKPDSEQPIAKN